MHSHRRRLSKSILIQRPTHGAGQSSMYARRMTVHIPPSLPDTTYLWGYILLTATATLFLGSMYALIGSKFMPDTNNKVLDWLKYDEYYCLLVPITTIVGIYFIVWNWMGMKFFRHN